MNKRHLHHIWTRLRPVKSWYLLAGCLVCAVVCVTALRLNYATMVRLRNAVYQADKANADVEAALQALRAQVNGHMNTSLGGGVGAVYPPIQLVQTYERLKQTEQTRVDSVNSQVYTAAQRYCEQLYPASFSGGPRVPCIEQYVKEHGTKAKAIPADLYRFSFATPRWSPDLAGWSLVLTVLLAILTLLRWLAGRILSGLTR